jgi:MFS family permease
MRTRRSGFRLLQDNAGFRALWLARTSAFFGDFVMLTAVVLYFYEAGASPTQLGIALAARVVPAAFGPVTGTLADLTDPRRLMIICDLGRFGALGLIAVSLPPYPVLVALIFATGALTACFSPASKGAVPKLVERPRLAHANSLLGLSHNLALAAGPVAGALLFGTAGARAAFALNAAAYVLSAGFLALLLPSIGWVREDVAHNRPGVFRREVHAGLRYLVRHRVARTVAIALFLGVFFAALDNVALVFLIQGDGHGGPPAVGLANGLYGLCMVLVPIIIAGTGWRVTGDRMLLLGFAFSATGLLLVGVAGELVIILVCYAIAGAGNGLENIACDTAIGENVDSNMLGRVFGAVYGPIFIAEAGAQLVSGPLLSATSASTVFVVAGCGLFGVLLVAGLMFRDRSGPGLGRTEHVTS